MPMSRIEVCAVIKSVAEAGMPPEEWGGAVAVAEGLLDKFGGALDAAPAPAPAARATPQASPSGGSGGPIRLTLQGSPETKGKATRVNAKGYPAGSWFSCFGDEAAAVGPLGAGSVIECEVIEKPNPNGGRPYLNLRAVRVVDDGVPF